jgi:DNA polymerase
VLARGTVPCDVLFVGEAPGESENVTGQPFTGPAGRLLDRIVEETIGNSKFTYAFTNVIACIPYDENGIKISVPDFECIEACTPRLIEFIDEVAKPKTIVAVGTVAKENLERGYQHSIKFKTNAKVVDIIHPAAILRKNITLQGMEVQRCKIRLNEVVEELELLETLGG